MVEGFEEIMHNALDDVDLSAEDLPHIDLYMDQVLTLFESGLSRNKRKPGDRLLTKTMVNNYSKERLMMPVKSKKYSREQLMQLLCILNLKHNLALSDVKSLTANEDSEIRFEESYTCSVELKEALRKQVPSIVETVLQNAKLEELKDREKMLVLGMAFSSMATYFCRICEGMVDSKTIKKQNSNDNE